MRPQHRPAVLLFTLLACGGPVPERRPESPPVAPPPEATGSRPGLVGTVATASVAFRRPLSDAEAEAFLARGGVSAVGVEMRVEGLSYPVEVEPRSAFTHMAEPRARAARSALAGLCRMRQRYRTTLAGMPAERREAVVRVNVPRFARLPDAVAALRRGEPAVTWMRVVGTAAELAVLERDPVVASSVVVRAGEPLPGPPIPPRRPDPSWAGLSAAEVEARAGRLLEGPEDCTEWYDPGAEGRIVRPEGRVVDGVAWTAEVRTEPDSPAGARTRPTLLLTVTARNVSGAPVEVWVRGCPVHLVAYLDEGRTRSAFDEMSGGQCMSDPRTLRLAPGASSTLGSGADARRILGAENPAGRYHLSARIRLRDRTLEVPAGHVELSPGLEDVRFQARSRVAGVAPARLVVQASAVNTGRKAVRLEYGDCSIRLRLSLVPGTQRGPRPRPARKTDDMRACLAYLAIAELAPGDTLSPKELRADVPVPEVMGDSLPDGRYRVSAVVELNGRTHAVAAGEVELTRRQAPLPAERTVGSLRWRARTRLVDRPERAVEAEVTVTNTGGAPAEARVARDCPIALFGYRDRARRDAALGSGEPEWADRAVCRLEPDAFRLAPGETRRFVRRHPTPPIALRGAGRWWFAVMVPGGPESPGLVLSAGDLDLRR